MKKIFCCLLGILLIFAFSSCSDKDKAGIDVENKTDDEALISGETVSGGSSERGDVPTHIQSNTETEGSSASDSAAGESSPQSISAVLALSSDVTEVSAGDKVTVIMNFSDCSYVTSLDVFIEADKGLTYESGSVFSISDFSMEISESSSDGYSVCRVAGFTMYTKDFENTDVCKVTYKIPSTAKSGDTFSVTVNPYDVQVGADEKGNTLLRITNDIKVNNIVFTVK